MQDDKYPRLFDEATALDIIERVKNFCSEDGTLSITVNSWWSGSQRWARNRATMTTDRRDVDIGIRRSFSGSTISVNTNQIDDGSLRGAVDLAEHYAWKQRSNAESDMELESGMASLLRKGKSVWSDVTFNRTATENGNVVHHLVQQAESQGMLSAGYIESMAARIVNYSCDPYGRETITKGNATEAQCSCTVRHPKGTGSGWAGNSSFELQRVDMKSIADRAFEKCITSLDPVRMEPGRYQVILEPQAVYTFASMLFSTLNRRDKAEYDLEHPFALGWDAALGLVRSKLGLEIVDRRINIHHNPEDPLYGTHPDLGMDSVYVVRNGVLTTMLNGYLYAQTALDRREVDMPRESFVMDGGERSIEDMISTMERGLLIARCVQPQVVHSQSMLATGFTRDGLWLIENGKISKAVRNFRWTESPLFMFNNVVDIGRSVPVFLPNTNGRTPFSKGYQDVVRSAVVPAMKVNDFNMSSTIEAI